MYYVFTNDSITLYNGFLMDSISMFVGCTNELMERHWRFITHVHMIDCGLTNDILKLTHDLSKAYYGCTIAVLWIYLSLNTDLHWIYYRCALAVLKL